MKNLQALIGKAVPVPELGTGNVVEFMVMPAGTHQCNFGQGGNAVRRSITVGPSSAEALQAQLTAVNARSPHRAYFDLNHNDDAASAWPVSYAWRESPAPGVYCKAELSAAGAEAIRGKEYRAFSPVFHATPGNPGTVICQPKADLNFGGLVNDPAFKQISPLWAKNAAGAQSSEDQHAIDMTPEELAALQAKCRQQEQEIAALKAKASTDATVSEALKAKESEHAADAARLENEALRAKNAKLESEITARNKKVADDAISEAIKRGAIPPKDEALQAKYRSLIESDPSNVVLVSTLPANPALAAGRVTPSANAQDRSTVTGGFSAKAAIKEYAALVAKNTKLPLNAQTAKEKGELALAAAAVYNEDIAKAVDVFLGMPLSAADTTDANLMTLAGTLTLQRTIELFQYDFGLLNSVYTDFSDSIGMFNQTEMTRVIITPAVQTYDGTLDADGKPKGWTTIVPAQTKDVPVTLDTHVGIPIVLGQDVLASTTRRLFDEQAPAALYSLEKFFANKILALMKPANFNAYAKVVAGKVPKAYASYPMGLDDCTARTLSRLKTILTKNEVPRQNRSIILGSEYYDELGNDPSLTTVWAALKNPEIMSDGIIPQLKGFRPIEAPNLEEANNAIVGWVGHKAGLVVKTRLPIDFTQTTNAPVPGSVTTVTSPKMGLSFLLVQRVDLERNYAEWRIEVYIGAAVGDSRGGLCLTAPVGNAGNK